MERIAASTLPFTGLDLATACERLLGLGFTAMELVVRGDGVWPGHCDPQRLATDPDYGAELARIIGRSGLALVSAGCEMATDLPLDEELRRHRALAPWLAGLGARALTVFIYDHPQAQTRWNELRAIADHHGLALAAESHLGTALADARQACRWAEDLDLRITLDASHWIGQGFTQADWAALLDRVEWVQVRHCRPGELQEPLAATDDDALRARLPQLIPTGYAGTVVCEQIANPNDPDWGPQLQRTAEAVRQHLGVAV